MPLSSVSTDLTPQIHVSLTTRDTIRKQKQQEMSTLPRTTLRRTEIGWKRNQSHKCKGGNTQPQPDAVKTGSTGSNTASRKRSLSDTAISFGNKRTKTTDAQLLTLIKALQQSIQDLSSSLGTGKGSKPSASSDHQDAVNPPGLKKTAPSQLSLSRTWTPYELSEKGTIFPLYLTTSPSVTSQEKVKSLLSTAMTQDKSTAAMEQQSSQPEFQNCFAPTWNQSIWGTQPSEEDFMLYESYKK